MPVPPRNDDTGGKCICGQCPTYPGKDQWTYCARGKSDKTIKKVSCLCPDCPVWSEYKLSMQFYCSEGTEDERS